VLFQTASPGRIPDLPTTPPPRPLSRLGLHRRAAIRFVAVSNALLHGLPVLLVIALIALIYSRALRSRPTYQLSQPFTHEPILWSAVDEAVPGDGHSGHAQSVGGGASGRW
jgi:hypothetical protein